MTGGTVLLHHRGCVAEDDLTLFVAVGYGQRHLSDVVTIVALKPLSNYVNYLAHTPLDPQFSAQVWKAQAKTVG
ncbi:MAG: hypothetical protein KF682_17325 [Nitrospira sp.]|nr:hypothetical protein [Nitrospira sp.]